MYNIEDIRSQFPILQKQVYGKPLVYFDNAATTQKPRCVVESMVNEYYSSNANVHRGIHFLSQQATELHEGARETVRRFIGAQKSCEVLFTRGTTESINLIAATFGEAFMQHDDEVILSVMEHHSNIVPWQLLAERKGINIRVIPIDRGGHLDFEAYRQLFNQHTKMVSIAHVSNVMGVVNPIKEFIDEAHRHNVPVLIDGAQSIPHFAIDVQALDADFYAFSGHKIYGPTGVGVLYGKEQWLEQLPPYQGGGEMIKSVHFEKTTFNELPYKFEAGTPDYVATAALSTALNFVSEIGMDNIAAHEESLTRYALTRLNEIEGIRIIGSPQGSAISFLAGNIHPSDIGTLLDKLGIAVRTGHHCAQPLMEHFGITGTVRASFGLYNTQEEVDKFIAALQRVVKMLR